MTALDQIFGKITISIKKILNLIFDISISNDCTVSQKEKKVTLPIYSNINYRSEIKLVIISKYYCLFQFDARKISLGQISMRGFCLTLFFSIQTPKFDNEILKFTSQIARLQIFTIFLTLI